METVETTSGAYNRLKVDYLNGLSKQALHNYLQSLKARNGWYVTSKNDRAVTYGRYDVCTCASDGYAPCYYPEDEFGETIGRVIEVRIKRRVIVLFAEDFENTLALRFDLPSLKEYLAQDSPTKKKKLRKTSDKNHYRR